MEEEEEKSLLDEARQIHKTLLLLNKMDELSIVATSSFPSYIYMKYDFTDKNLFREENFEEYMDDMEFIGSLQMFISLANAVIDGVPMKNKKDMIVYQQEAYGFNAARKAEKEAAEKQKKDFEEYERKRKEEEEEEKREIGKSQKKFKNQKDVKRKKFIECLACGEDAKQIEKTSNKTFCNLKCQIKFYQK